MSDRMERTGVFRGKITDLGVTLTKSKKHDETGKEIGLKPQLAVSLSVTAHYVQDKDVLEHFELEEPGWVDWSDYDETITGFLLLFNATAGEEPFTDDNAMFHYANLQDALGWEGDEFDSLQDGSHVGNEVLFVVAEEEYKGKSQFRIQSIKHRDASTSFEVGELDEDSLAAINKSLRGLKKKKAPAKPSAPPKTSTKAKKSDKEELDDAADEALNPKKAKAKSKKAAPKKSAPPKKEEPEEVEEEVEDDTPVESVEGLPATSTKEEAWEFIDENKGANDDGTIADAWMSACEEVGGERPDTEFTEEDWAKVRDIVINDLDLTVE